MSEPEYISLRAAAERFGVSLTTIKEAINQGHFLKHYPTSHPVVAVADVRAWVQGSPKELSKP